MNAMRKSVAALTVAGSVLTGGVLGATFFAANPATAATTSSTNAPPAASGAPGTFHSNETAAHEKTESAAREAQENAGQFPTVP
jgi:hypothetical protein